MSELSKAKRHIRQLEKCLEDIQRILFERAVEINSTGRDGEQNPEYQLLQHINRRINRTHASSTKQQKPK